jgi:GT2 family glycosyltransferase
LPHPPLVSIVMATRGGRRPVRGTPTELVSHALRSLVGRTDYPAYELVVVLTDGCPADLRGRLTELAGQRPLRVVRDPGGFDFSRACHTGVAASHGALVCLLNDDIEVTHPDWLRRMVEHATRPEVGVVGAQLHYEDGRIQHAGVVQVDGFLAHRFAGASVGNGPNGLLSLDVDYAAVTGACLVTRRRIWDELGGLSSQLPLNYGDVDYCLRARGVGAQVVLASGAVLVHFESSSREDFRASSTELSTWRALWGERLAQDPYLADGPMGC